MSIFMAEYFKALNEKRNRVSVWSILCTPLAKSQFLSIICHEGFYDWSAQESLVDLEGHASDGLVKFYVNDKKCSIRLENTFEPLSGIEYNRDFKDEETQKSVLSCHLIRKLNCSALFKSHLLVQGKELKVQKVLDGSIVCSLGDSEIVVIVSLRNDDLALTFVDPACRFLPEYVFYRVGVKVAETQ